MKRALITALFLLAGCSSTQFATYRPPSSNEQSWQINVKHTSGVTENFMVIINDSTVIDKAANFFTGSLEEKGKYQDREIKLLVTYTPGFLGIGAGYEALIFVNNELAGKFKF